MIVQKANGWDWSPIAPLAALPALVEMGGHASRASAFEHTPGTRNGRCQISPVTATGRQQPNAERWRSGRRPIGKYSGSLFHLVSALPGPGMHGFGTVVSGIIITNPNDAHPNGQIDLALRNLLQPRVRRRMFTKQQPRGRHTQPMLQHHDFVRRWDGAPFQPLSDGLCRNICDWLS